MATSTTAGWSASAAATQGCACGPEIIVLPRPPDASPAGIPIVYVRHAPACERACTALADSPAWDTAWEELKRRAISCDLCHQGIRFVAWPEDPRWLECARCGHVCSHSGGVNAFLVAEQRP